MKSCLAIAFVVSLAVMQVTSQGAQNENAQAQKASSQDPMGQLFPLMALGGMNDKFLSSYFMLNMLGGQNNGMRGGLNGINPLFLGPMFGMEMGLF